MNEVLNLNNLSLLQRLSVLDKHACELTFTDIPLAQSYLSEIKNLLEENEHPDIELNYHLNTALIENQLYNYDLSESEFKKAIEILKDRGDVSQLAEAYTDYAGTLINLGDVEKARYYLSEAANYLLSFPDDRLFARIKCREGYLHLKNSNNSKALASFQEAEMMITTLGKNLRLKDYYFISLIQSGLGSIYFQYQELEKSIKAYKEVVRLCEKKAMRSRLSWHYLNVGNGYMAMHDYDNAIRYFKDAIKVFDDVNQQARANAYANLGYCYSRKGLNVEALELMSRAYPLFKEKREKNLSNIEWWRGQVYFNLGKRKKALKFMMQAFEHARNAIDYKQMAGILKNVANIYEEESDYKNAHYYQKLAEQAVENYFLELKATEIKELEVKYEAEKKEKEAEVFKLQATGLQLKALRAQMNPHFVFNALNSIQNYITSNDTTQAAYYLAKFAHLMRQSLEYSELEIISLEKELDFLKDYLEINQKLRFEHKLNFQISVDEDIEEDICGVPTMIVQPYVENCIEHGIRSMNSGMIDISFHLKDENSILCIIQDNGVGREKAKLFQLSNPNLKNHKSLGTKITQERLEILLKSKNRNEEAVKVIDLKDKKTNEAIGTRVELLIPIIDLQKNITGGGVQNENVSSLPLINYRGVKSIS